MLTGHHDATQLPVVMLGDGVQKKTNDESDAHRRIVAEREQLPILNLTRAGEEAAGVLLD